MGTMSITTDQETDTFLLKRLAELSQEGKVSLKEGRNGVVRYLIKQAMEEIENGKQQ